MKKLLFLVVTLVALALPCVAGSCPDGGIEGAHKECCKNNFVYNHSTKRYDYVQERLCGCPNGGKPGSSNTYYCCKDSYAYNEKTGQYDYLNPEECGCPNGGTIHRGVGVNGGNVCCKDGYAHEYYFGTDPVIYDEISPEKCGCPNGMTPDKENGAYCCKNGRVYLGKHEYGVQPNRCGCPDGGQVWKDRFCQKNGYMWNDNTKAYDIPNPILGCPKGSEEKNGVCCKNGYAFNAYTAKFESINGVCGCQKGSKPSEWGTKYKQLLASGGQKITLEEQAYGNKVMAQLNTVCCKEGKRYNEETGQFDLDSSLCGPFPTTGEELFLKLFEEARWGRLMLH